MPLILVTDPSWTFKNFINENDLRPVNENDFRPVNALIMALIAWQIIQGN